MSEPNQHYAYFTITGSFDPAEITSRLGVQATESWRQGELHPRTSQERKFSRWSLRSRLSKDEPIEDHILDVLAQLGQSQSSFLAVSQEFEGWMQLVGYYHEQFTGLTLSTEIIQGLAKYHLQVDCDFYYLWSDSRENT